MPIQTMLISIAAAMIVACACLADAPTVTRTWNDPEKTVVFKSGEGGYHTYRIPALIATKKGTLLAF